MTLLERTAELEALAAVLDEVTAGTGRIVLIEGPPGIGKTALIGAAQSLAIERGIEVLDARGGELEIDFAFGVVRQLFERRILASDPDQFEALFTGAASLAAGLFNFGEAKRADAPPPEDRFALFHGLYWLATGLAGEGPLALVVDDAHWSDEPSLQWLDYLARRIDDLPILIVLAARSTRPEAPVPALEAIRVEPGVLELRPSPLSHDSVGSLLEQVFNERPHEAFTAACQAASGGNPFLLTELAQALSADGVSPDETGTTQLEGTNPAGIGSLMLVRLGHLPSQSQAMAIAAAVLGDGASLRDAGALAELDEDQSREAADSLVAAGFLSSSRPIRFQHPLARAAIYGDLPEADRAGRHQRAAEILRDRGASAERISAHLLLCEGDEERWVAESLMSAAATAMDRGAPHSAILYLRRAVSSEDLAETRAELLFALGSAEAQALDARGVEHLHEAARLARNPAERVQATRTLALLLARMGQVEEAVGRLSGELAGLSEHDPIRRDLEADLAATAHWGLEDPAELLDRILADAPSLRGATPAERSLLASRACWDVKTGRDADRLVQDALRALEAGLLEDHGPASPAWANAVDALVATDSPEARRWLEEGMRVSSATGSRFGTSLNSNLLSLLSYREGAIADAEAFAWESLAAARELPGMVGLPPCLQALADAMIERGKADEAWQELVADGFDGELPEATFKLIVYECRGRVRVALRDLDRGIADLREAGRCWERLGVTAPTITRWRSELAQACVMAGETAQARELAEADLAAARGFGRARPIGIALRALGLTLDGEESVARLQEAVEVLEPSRAQLEHARALCDLGAALRRANRRREARESLSLAVDIATRCGAVVVAERATEELRATGARPRRVMLSGVESLTASELRVARLAAEGLTNREIAQTLFVTDKTVEKHLGNAYGKLEIKSRDELPAALA